MASTTLRRATTLDGKPWVDGVHTLVTDFAVFIDTHRDQPHVPTFEPDIHRGWCKPTPVDYVLPHPSDTDARLGLLITYDADGTAMAITVHEKHRFVENEWWGQYVLDFIAEHGRLPTSQEGEQAGHMPTSHLRDARKRVYHLRSLRQMILHRATCPTCKGA